MTSRIIAVSAFLLLLASTVCADGAVPIPSGPKVLADADMPENVVRALLKPGGYPGAQVGLIRQIEKKGRVEFLPELVELLRDKNEAVREASGVALASFGVEKIAAPVDCILRDVHQPAYARELAARTLAATGRPEAVEPLLAVLDDPALVDAAMKGLSAVTFQEIAAPDAWRRWWAENKTRTRTDWAAARIEELKRRIAGLGKDRESDRKAAAESADKLGEAAVKFLDLRADRTDPAPLVAALDVPDPSGRVRRYAAAELGKLKAKPAAAKLAELAASSEDASLRAECAAALGLIAAPESTGVLGQLLSDPSETVAASAALALGRMKAEGATNRLLVGLLHGSPAVRSASAKALGDIGATAGVVPLGELLASDRDASVRERAAQALGQIGDARARGALEKALADESDAVRVYAVEALGQMGIGDVATRLGSVLEKDPSPSVREAAAVALGKVGGADAAPTLVRALDHADGKLASLAWSSLQAACRRDDALARTTADGLARAGKIEAATTLYENLERALVEKKDEAGLIAARVKLAGLLAAQKQWTRAAAVLDLLVRTLPDDVPLAQEYATVLREAGRLSDALRVYETLAARKDAKPYWDERAALLEAMLAEKKNSDVTKAVDAALAGEPKPPEDVAKKLEDLKRRSTGQ